MELFDFAHFLRFDDSLNALANRIALNEPWGYSDPAKEFAEGNNAAKFTFPILRNYLEHTFRKLKSENKIVSTSDAMFCCFNTGLVTPNLEEIYALFEKNRNPAARSPYFFKAFIKKSDIEFLTLFSSCQPEPANYFEKPDLLIFNPRPKFISTSYIERQNLTMRMHMRRFTRLTNAFSKKVENHCHAIALHFVYYNFVKIHQSLSVPPAMQAGLTKKPMTIEDIVRLTEI